MKNKMIGLNTNFEHKKNSDKQVVYIKVYCVIVLIVSLITPSFPIASGIPAIHISDVLLLLSPFYIGLVVGRIVLDVRVIVLMTITVLIIWSILWGAILGFNASFGDLFFVIRMAKYIGSVVLASALVMVMKSCRQALRWFLQRFVIIGLGLGLIVIQQYFDIFSLNATYVKFVAPTQYETLVGGYPWPRPVGMIGNPNELGFLLGLLALTSVWLFFVKQTGSYRWAILGFIYFVLMGLTMSRSAGFSILGGLFILLIMFGVQGLTLRKQRIVIPRTFFRVFLLIVLLGISFQIIISKTNAIEEILWRFSGEYVEQAYETRSENWSENLELIKKSPFWGVGTLKHSGDFQYAADNEWLLLYRIGGGVLPLLVASIFVLGSVMVRKQSSREARVLVVTVAVASFVYMIPAALFFSLTIMPMVLFILVLAAPLPTLRIKILTGSKTFLFLNTIFIPR